MFGKVGLAKATVDEIAERAGVSKGTIYLYFATKEELFRQSIREALNSTIDEAVPVGSATAIRQLNDTITRYWRFLNSETGITVHRLVNAEQSHFPELAELYAREVVVRLNEKVAVIIQRGIEAGEFRDTDPAVSARMLAALIVQSAAWANGGVEILAGEGAEKIPGEVTEFFLRAMAPEDTAFAQADGAPAYRGGLNN